jgi:DNA-directed RNA polymerase specialized sigma24 family protein
MPDDGSITIWLGRLKDGDGDAVEKIWREYFPRLVALARAKLRDMPRRAADEEDAALSAFDSFCRAAEQGRFPRLDNRDDLWRLLVMIAARKAHDLRQSHGRQKRGGGQVRGDSAVIGAADGSDEGWGEIVGTAPTPEFAAQAAEEYGRLLARLANDEFRSIAVWKMEGLTNAEVAERLGCALSSVERRLRIIRKTWEAELKPATAP